MVSPPTNRFPWIVVLSVGGHVALAFVLARLPVGQAILQKVIPVQMVERHKERPRPKNPPKPKAKVAKSAAKPSSRPRPVPASAILPNALQTFGVGDGAGTMEVPVGETLEAEATASAADPLVLNLSDDAPAVFDRAPSPIGRLRVSYPEVARLSGATGSALVEAYVEADGRASRIELIAASSPLFGRAALEAARGTRFRPAVRLGVSVASSIRLPIRFDLSGIVIPEASPDALSTASEDPS